jgi:hypothetical protein
MGDPCGVCLEEACDGEECVNHHHICKSCFANYAITFLNEEINTYDIPCPSCRAPIPYVKNGLITTYHENGAIKMKAQYKDNKLHGLCEEYDEDGVKISEFTYIDDKMRGDRREWYDNGKLWLSCSYDDDGRRHGAYEEYFMNGQLWRRGSYIHGMRADLFEEYSIDGVLILKENY